MSRPCRWSRSPARASVPAPLVVPLRLAVPVSESVSALDMLSVEPERLTEGPSVGEGLADGQARRPARFREVRRIHAGAAAQRRVADVSRDGVHIGIGVEGREGRHQTGRRIRDVEPPAILSSVD